MANPRRRSRALRYFGAGGWPVGLPETIFRATAKASATASLALASVVLALGVGPTGFPKQAKRGDLGRRQPWQTRAVARARSVISALGAGPSGFPKQSSGRDSHGKPAPSLAHAPLFWRWGLARRASRNKFPSDAKRGNLEAAAAYAARSLCRNTGASGRNFFPRGQPHVTAHLPGGSACPTQGVKLAKPAPTVAQQERPGGETKHDTNRKTPKRDRSPGRAAHMSPEGVRPQWPFYQPEADKLPESGCGWPISYCPV